MHFTECVLLSTLSGVILMSLCYSAEREQAARALAPCVVDPENASTDLLPFLACEESSVRTVIIAAIAEPR